MMLLPKNHIKFTKNNFYVPYNSRFYLAKEFEITEIYQIKKNSEIIHEYYGKHTEKGLETNTSFMNDGKMNMRGEIMIMKRNDRAKCRWLPECLHLEIWEDMGKALNFT